MFWISPYSQSGLGGVLESVQHIKLKRVRGTYSKIILKLNMKKYLQYFSTALFFIMICNRVFAQTAPVISYPNNPTTPTYVYTAGSAISPLNITNTGGAVTANSLTTFSTDPSGGQPYGIAYDPTTGDIITDDYANGDVYRYSPSGALLNTYTASIHAGGPKDIVVDNSGNIFVANGLGGNIVKITPAGVTTTISAPSAPFNQPDGMTINRVTGTIYIADQGTDDVYSIASGATTATVYKSGFTDLYGVTVNSSTGVVYVSEYTPQADIKQISTSGVVTTFVSKAAGGFTDLRNLDIDAAGDIFVANYGNNSIDEFSPTGVFLGHIVTGLNQPRATAEDVFGNLYIANSGGGDVEEYSTAFYSINIPLPAGMSFNTTTGQITGTPTVTSPTTVYTVVGHNSHGSGYTTVTITVDPTAPTGTGDFTCGSGVVNLTASGGFPAGGTYNWYAASTGGAALATGAAYNPSISTTTTFYLDYTQGGVTCAARVPVVGTVSANPIISTAPTSGAYFSYSFTGGITTDISGSNNGTKNGAPVTTADRYSTAGNAYSFASASSQYISTTTSYVSPGPQAFSISVWFQTSTAGGYLVGFGNLQTGNSTNVDRVLYIGSNGQLYFGLAPGGTKKTLNTVATYNDGNWHHAVATFSAANGSNIYVDGALAASDPTMNAVLATAGYWRVAHDVLTGYTNPPASAYFNGALDDIAVANTELTPAQINVLYGAGSSALFCPGNPLSLTVNTVASCTYSWVGPSGSGFTSALQNPTVPAANAIAGIYVCTVTGAAGCTSVIKVTAPSNVITYTWTGAAGTTVPTTAGNWDHLPLFTSTTNLVIPTGLAKYPLLTANESVWGLTIASGASFSLGGFTLSVGCNIINNASTGGTGILYGSNNSSGITWNGSYAAQSYTGTNTTNTAQIGIMTINNSSAGTISINSGPVDIYNLLTMTKGNLSVSASPAALTLKSSIALTASVTAIPLGCGITGNVNVERYIQGSSSISSVIKRGYRLISSTVYTGTVSGVNVFDINYLKNSVLVSGLNGTGNGFNVTTPSNNASVYLFREDDLPPPTNGTFFRYQYNWKGIAQINNSPVYNIGIQKRLTTTNLADTITNIPVGNGVLFFFRGNTTLSNGTTAGTKIAAPFNYPEDVVTTQVGSLNTGTVNVKLWFANAGNGLNNNFSVTSGYVGYGTSSLTGGYTCVGNPYASTINWEKYNRNGSNSSIYGAGSMPSKIWIFNQYNDQYEAYTQKTTISSAADTTTTVNPGTAQGAASNMIFSGQGFFIKATVANSQTLSFRETAKTSTQPSTTSLYDQMSTPHSGPKEFVIQPEPLFRLKLIKDTINTDEIVIRMNKQSSMKFVDSEDAEDLGGSNALESLSAFSADSMALSIDYMPFPGKQTEVVPLLVDATASGSYKLANTQLDNLQPIYKIWLKDAFTNDSLLMKAGATYSFTIDKSNPATFGTKRFTVVIGQDTTFAYKLLNFTANKTSSAVPQVQLTWTTKNEQNYTSFTVERSTDGGKTFAVIGGLPGTGAGNYSLLDNSPVEGTNLYRLKQEDLNDSITYSKAVPVQFSGAISKLSVYPNPATSLINVSIADNAGVKPPYTIQITNTSGFVIRQVNSAQQNWQTNIGDLMPGTYIVKVHNSTDNTNVGDSKFVKL